LANVLIANFLFTNAGVPIEGATVDLLARNTTTPVLATTTTSAAGYWAFSHATEGRFDVRITNGSSVRWHMYDASAQFTALEVQTLRVRNPAFTFDYDIVPGAITADRQLNLPVITGTDTLAVLGLAQTFTADKTFNDSVNLTFGTGGDADIYYDGTNLIIAPRIVGTGNVIINTTAILFINDTANANMTVGWTVNQAGADNEAGAFKSSDVAHGRTGITETDTYAAFLKASATQGGLRTIVTAVNATGNPYLVTIYGMTPSTAKTTAADGAVTFYYESHDDANVAANVPADSNMLVLRLLQAGAATTRHIFDAEGTYHGDEAATTFDDYDDLALLDAQHDIASVPTPERVELMERVGIFGRGSFRLENGVPKAFVNTTRHRQLLHSGLRFAWHEVREATERIAALEGQITELRHRLEAGRN